MTTRAWAAATAVLVAVATLLVWLGTGGPFWPRWVWLGLGTATVATILTHRVRQVPARRRRWLMADGALLVVLTPVETTVWLFTGRGFYWPVYSLLTLSIVFGAHVWFIARRPDPEERALTARVDTLTRTRRGAVDGQTLELRRIERDLHDGAQARMVSVALSIGIAEGKLTTDPARAAQVLADARTAAVGAVTDLRDVMHGIYPAVLSDRGLVGAVEALVCDLPIPVTVHHDGELALPAAAESAVYFAVAECLTNAVKHGRARSGWVRFGHDADGHTVAVGDDGRGGASLAAGTGLRGVVDRLAAFDATLTVDSPPGGPTVVTIHVPRAD